MQIINNSDPSFPQRGRTVPQSDGPPLLSRKLVMECLNDLLPSVETFTVGCEGARLKIQFVPSEGGTQHFFPTDGPQRPIGSCRVFQVAVFALRDGAHAETDSDALVEYRLNFDPHAPLGLTLGETLRPYLDQRRDRTIGQREEKTGESLLQEIAAILGKRSDVSWDLFPSSEEKWVTAKELGPVVSSEDNGTTEARAKWERAIKQIVSNHPGTFLARVVPSFEEFVTDRHCISTKFLSTYNSEELSSVLLTTVNPERGTISLDLQSRGTSGRLLARERFTSYLDRGESQSWLMELRDRVYNPAPTGSAGNQERGTQSSERLNRLLNHMVEPAIAFRELGPGGLRNVLSRAEAFDLVEETLRDQTILEGVVDLDANQLVDDVSLTGYSDRQSYNSNNNGAYVHLEIGDRVACGSVMANCREGSANIAWYLKNSTPFKSSDTSVLEAFWRALEQLRSPSEGGRYSAIDTLGQICLPCPQGLSDPQDVLDFNVHSIPQVAFSSVKPVLPGQIARVAEGIEDIDATVMTKGFQWHFPQNFFMMRFSLHNDGALSIQAINSFKARISAYLPAASFDEHKRSRSDTIELLSKLLVSRPEGSRQRIQKVISKLVDEDLGGWQSSADNRLVAPGGCQDLPPADAKIGNKAYDHAARIARIFCEENNTVCSEIPIKLITKRGDSEPIACRLDLNEGSSSTKMFLLVDHLGLKGVLLRLGALGRSISENDLVFLRRSKDEVPFREATSLRNLFGEFRLIGESVEGYLVGGAHPKTRVAALIDRLYSEMRLKGES